jgi:predicted nucleotidyltransferase
VGRVWIGLRNASASHFANSAASPELMSSIAFLIVQRIDENCPSLRFAGEWVAEGLFFIEIPQPLNLKKKGRFAPESAETQQDSGKLEIEFSIKEWNRSAEHIALLGSEIANLNSLTSDCFCLPNGQACENFVEVGIAKDDLQSVLLEQVDLAIRLTYTPARFIMQIVRERTRNYASKAIAISLRFQLDWGKVARIVSVQLGATGTIQDSICFGMDGTQAVSAVFGNFGKVENGVLCHHGFKKYRFVEKAL